ISLQHERMLGSFGKRARRARGTRDIDILLNELPVVEDAQEASRFDLLARGVETRRAKPDLIRLPLAWTTCSVDEWRRTANATLIYPLVIHRARVRRRHRVAGAPAVEDLDLVQPLKI